jgi:hypothetical protein
MHLPILTVDPTGDPDTRPPGGLGRRNRFLPTVSEARASALAYAVD